MVFTVTARQSGNTGTSSAQTLTTSSATPTADSLLLVCSVAQNDGVGTDPAFQSPSGGLLPYTQVDGIGDAVTIPWDGSAQFRLSGVMYRAAVGGSPFAFTVTVDHHSDTTNAYYAALCLDITGHDDASPVVQAAANGADGGAGDNVAGTVTLGVSPTVGNLVVAAFGAGTDGAGGFAAPTFGGQPMTQVFNQDILFTQEGVWYRVVDGTETTDTITCSDVGDIVGNWTAIAVEIAVGEAAGGVVQGTATVNLGGLALTATGKRVVHGTASLTLGGLTLTAAGKRAVHGTASLTLGGLTLTAAGIVTGVTTGTADVSLGGLALTATGRRVVHGSTQLQLGGLNLAAVGQVEGVTLGAANLPLGGLSLTGAGKRVVHGSLALSLGGIVLTAIHDTADPNPLHFSWRDRSTHGSHTEASHGLYRESTHAVHQES